MIPKEKLARSSSPNYAARIHGGSVVMYAGNVLSQATCRNYR